MEVETGSKTNAQRVLMEKEREMEETTRMYEFRTIHHIYEWSGKDLNVDEIWIRVQNVLEGNRLKVVKFIIYKVLPDYPDMPEWVYMYVMVDKWNIRIGKKEFENVLPTDGSYSYCENATLFIQRLILNDYSYTTNFDTKFLKEVTQLTNGRGIKEIKKEIKDEKKRQRDLKGKFLNSKTINFVLAGLESD